MCSSFERILYTFYCELWTGASSIHRRALGYTLGRGYVHAQRGRSPSRWACWSKLGTRADPRGACETEIQGGFLHVGSVSFCDSTVLHHAQVWTRNLLSSTPGLFFLINYIILSFTTILSNSPPSHPLRTVLYSPRNPLYSNNYYSPHNNPSQFTLLLLSVLYSTVRATLCIRIVTTCSSAVKKSVPARSDATK